jgi:hypothetical protein
MLNRMVELAKVTGDIRQNALVPDQVIFRHNAYWTSHFGGLYVFVDPGMTTVISDPSAPGFRRSRPWQVSYLSLHDARAHLRLPGCRRADRAAARLVDRESGYLEHRAEMTDPHLIHQGDPKTRPRDGGPVWLQTWIHATRPDRRDGTFPFLNAAKREMAALRPDQDGRRGARAPLPRRARQARPSGCVADNRLISDFVPSTSCRATSSTSRASTATYRQFSGSLARAMLSRR